ncbi:alpha,alpha-trehalose-phosphate synthase (UDP-forming) [Halomarina litorea]|uniref:alpha,alpha-trehalose-phosphate synthase (UDP-forming) n=1 Tax=Halomarina litorea TaxID=2961595 RepID=UPI0020C54F52|nr:trehalose-6-phosphate synthase [Halomarina sp. BCD28]
MTPSSDTTAEAPGSLGDLLVVSNRQPYRHYYEGDEVAVDRPAGGLTAGLDPVMQRTDGTWVAWGDGEADRAAANEDGEVRLPPEDESYTLKRVWLSDEAIEGYYYGYSNRVLWPLCHGGTWLTEYAQQYWDCYQSVNEQFADAVIDRADADTTVWFQDYHFALAPRRVREATDAFLMHFWHITWPGADTFRACPQREALLDGLLGNDLLGFHVERYCRNFLDCVEDTFDDAFIDREGGRVRFRDHTTHVAAFPMGIDAEATEAATRRADGEHWRAFCEDRDIAPETRVVLGVDRLDYTKGIVERLEALERLFEIHPEWQGNLVYVQKADESRSLIPEYQNLQQNVAKAVERIDERFGTDDWVPVVYTTDWFTQEELCDLYRHSDAMLVSALRDGMNLVAKEYVAAQIDDDGVLVLSDQVGAHDELGDFAVSFNPYDTDGFAETIHRALTMDSQEVRARMRGLRGMVAGNDLYAWMNDIFAVASELRDEGRDGDWS